MPSARGVMGMQKLVYRGFTLSSQFPLVLARNRKRDPCSCRHRVVRGSIADVKSGLFECCGAVTLLRMLSRGCRLKSIMRKCSNGVEISRWAQRVSLSTRQDTAWREAEAKPLQRIALWHGEGLHADESAATRHVAL
jgi:hypothetical protein